MTDAYQPQPAPKPAQGDVWAEIINDTIDPVLLPLYNARREMGIVKYGTPLQRGNGRDHLVDLREELLDAVAYATAAGCHSMRRDLERLIREVTTRIEWRSKRQAGPTQGQTP